MGGQVFGQAHDCRGFRPNGVEIDPLLECPDLPLALGVEEGRHELVGVVSCVHDHPVELDLHVVLDVECEGEDCLAKVVVEPRELGEVGEVEVDVGAEVLRVGVVVA